MYQNSLSNYQKVEVETTDSLKLIVMLYEGGISFLEQAKLRLQEKKMADKGVLISKVLAIISELQTSLDMSKGGEVAGNIDRIYSYMHERLVEANMNNNVEIIDEVLTHMRTLKEAWVQVRNQQSEEEKAKTAKAAPKPAPQAGKAGYAQGQAGGQGFSSGNQNSGSNFQPLEIMG
jgi:flagellar protein FliS